MLVAVFSAASATALANENGKSPFRPLFGGASVSIGAEGNALVRGAEVTEVHDGYFLAETKLGDTTLSWTVDTDSDTEYVGANGASADESDVDEGDTVSFSGMLTSSLTVAADVVREWLHAAGEIAFSGTVDELGDDHFTLEHDKGGKHDVIVEVDGSTDITVDGEDASFADIEEGMRVKAIGEYDSESETLEASALIAGKIEKSDKDYWKPFKDFWGKFKLNWEHK